MDVQTLALSLDHPRLPTPARPGRRRTNGVPAAGRGHDGPGSGSAKADARRRSWLYAYTGATILAGMGALLWTTLAVPVLPGIDPGLGGTALAGPDGGMLVWIAFGFIGSLRVLPIPGGSGVWTFHLPFIAAAMVLGGPTAGAWVAFLSTIERRELASQPWYGALANHAVMALAAVIGGLTVLVVRGALAAAGVEPSLASLAAIGLGTLVLAAVGDGIAAGTIMLREGLSPLALVEILVRSFGGITLAEIGLAWVFVTLFTTAGWWAPMALAVAVLMAWPREGVEFMDPLTKLPRDRMFRGELDGVLARTRRGLAPGGLLVLFDLDGFGQLNKDHGQHIGDEVLAQIGSRVRAEIRSTDFAGRRGGDEFALFYTGVGDVRVARQIARRLEASIRQPVATTAGTMQVGVSIGALVVQPDPEIPPGPTLMEWADKVVQEVKKAQREGRTKSGVGFHSYGTRPGASESQGSRDGLDGREPGLVSSLLGDRAVRLASLSFGVVVVAFALWRVAGG